MTTDAKTRPMTADELFHMPDDGFRCELVRGELRKMPFAAPIHSETALRIGASLLIHARANRLGRAYGADTGFELASDHVRAPDAAFVRAERADAAQDADGFFPGPPDLAVEVISFDDLYMDVVEKIEDWLAAGTLAVVVANPRNRTVKIHRPNEDEIILSEDDVLEIQDVVPGWRMPVAEIFRIGAE